MSGVAIGVVGILVGVIIIGGVIYWILQPGRDRDTPPIIVPEATATRSVTASSTTAPPQPLPATGVDRRPPAGPAGMCEPGAPCLRVSVDGPSSVSYFLADNTTEVSCPPTCEASFPQGRRIYIYRTRDLSPQQENGARMTAWSGHCSYLVAEREPRGGVCELTLDGDREVAVFFEIRPRLEVQILGKQGWFSISFEPEQVFVNGARSERITCGARPCSIEFFYDLGTQVTMESARANHAYLRRWGGGCAGVMGYSDDNSVPAQPCTVTLNGDTTVTIQFSSVQCTRGDCVYDPP